MCTYTNDELESKVRESLYQGSIDLAEQWLHEIHDQDLYYEMKQLICEYSCNEY